MGRAAVTSAIDSPLRFAVLQPRFSVLASAKLFWVDSGETVASLCAKKSPEVSMGDKITGDGGMVMPDFKSSSNDNDGGVRCASARVDCGH